MRKKLLSICLAIVIFISSFVGVAQVQAATATLTSGQIADFFNGKVGQSVPQASCLAFIADGFQSLGATRSSSCCAYNYGSSHIVSTSMDNIPVGADVFLNWNSNYSYTKYVCPTCGQYCHHVGVYVGDGYVVHTSGGKVVKTLLSKLTSTWNMDFRGWGYHGNVVITGTNTDGTRVKNTGVTEITETTAKINAKINPGATVSEVGFYYGKSPDNMQKVVESSNSYVEYIWYNLGTGKWTGALERGTTYYYQIYAIIGGVTYKSTVDSFTTGGDIVPPTISNVTIVDQTRDGYTVNCDVTDSSGVARVCYPTWTDANGQDDINGDWYNALVAWSPVSGNTYSYRINVSDHNYEGGTYTTHIYAYDNYGNHSYYEVKVNINRELPLTNFTLNTSSISLEVGQSQNLQVESYTPSDTTSNKAASWYSENTGVATVDGNGKVTGVNAGTTNIVCTVAGIQKRCQVMVTALSQQSQVRSFVERMYTIVLGRASDPNGLNDWSAGLIEHRINGADLVKGFVNSEEFQMRGVNNQTYIEILYRAILNREADAAGKADWLRALSQGQNRQDILNGFLVSPEFASLCNSYGIIATKTYSPQVRAFVERMYTVALNRGYDEKGLNDWVVGLLNGVVNGAQVADGFINSPEFAARGLSNDQYIETLYLTFFNRASDAAGKADWLRAFALGQSRRQVMIGFENSEEFRVLCENYGIIRGTLQ